MKTMSMEDKARQLLDNCVRIVCELPVGDPEIVREASAGKLIPEEEPNDDDRNQVKILVPVLQWLLEPPTKKPRKKKVAAKGGESKKDGVRKKRSAKPKGPPKDPPKGPPKDPPKGPSPSGKEENDDLPL